MNLKDQGSPGQDISAKTEAPRITAMKYYDRGCCETRKFISSNDLNYYEGCIVKYVVRWRHKSGLKDLYKARDYLNWLIEGQENLNAKSRPEPIEMSDHTRAFGEY